MPVRTQDFVDDFLNEINEKNAAIFAGAGLSIESGHVGWKELLKDIVSGLNLDINKENDLVTLSQYHLNSNGNNRSVLNQKLLSNFHHGTRPNINHEILSRLPISTYWTTNYDKLIEKALDKANKIVDVKYTENQLSHTVHGREVVLYKMHGDVDHPSEAILSKDQYENYFKTHGLFINALSGDLISKTFLFIGFSFSDPNLDYILSRIRVSFKENQRKHYCILKEVIQENDTNEDYQYKKIKQELAIADLLRFNIHTILVKEYTEITNILKTIENRFRRKTIYISGSAIEYGKRSTDQANHLISTLSQKLIQNDYKIVSGFGLGVGSFVIEGALREVYLNKKENLKDQLLLRPFPQTGDNIQETWDKYRRDMISYTGISIFIFGNKLKDGKIIDADGLEKEFEISISNNSLVIPIGATGYVAEKLWKRILEKYDEYFSKDEHKNLFIKLGDDKLSEDEMVSAIIEFINHNI